MSTGPLSSSNFLYVERNLGGADPNGLATLATTRTVGTTLRDISVAEDAPGALWILTTGIDRTLVWTQLGVGAGTSGVARYYVSPAGELPVTGYTTGQGAVDAAVADGHGADTLTVNPAGGNTITTGPVVLAGGVASGVTMISDSLGARWIVTNRW